MGLEIFFFFFPGGEHLIIIIITVLQTRETEAQKDEATCPRSPKRPAAEPESETESLNIQSWFLEHCPLGSSLTPCCLH